MHFSKNRISNQNDKGFKNLTFFIFDTQIVIAELHPVLKNYSEKVFEAIEQQHEPGMAYLTKRDPADQTPFTTICHGDLWITNIMIKKGRTFQS